MTARFRFAVALLLGSALVAAGCAAAPPAAAANGGLSYAIYAEYAKDANKLMKNGLNRRVFNKVEAQAGADIALNADGSISLAPGTYRISGISTVTMQTTFAPPKITHDINYPGYSMVYPKAAENTVKERTTVAMRTLS